MEDTFISRPRVSVPMAGLLGSGLHLTFRVSVFTRYHFLARPAFAAAASAAKAVSVSNRTDNFVAGLARMAQVVIMAGMILLNLDFPLSGYCLYEWQFTAKTLRMGLHDSEKTLQICKRRLLFP